MKRIAIQDANILIDLVKTGLFDHCMALQYQFTTTNIILDELHDNQQATVQPHINSGKFIIIEISEIELIEIQIMGREDHKLSEQDWSAIYYAERKEAFLLSGDKQLRKISEAKGITVCGIFWLLDQLIETGTITKHEGCLFLNDLISKNKRLPQEEIEKRKKDWCDK